MMPPILAQAAQSSTDWTGLLLQAGVAGVVLAWFMWRDGETRKNEAIRAEKDGIRIKGLENAIDRMARANLILVLSLKQADVTAKEKAGEVIGEIDRKEKE